MRKLLLAALLVFSLTGVAFAGGGVNVTLSCPSYVRYLTGSNTLYVSATLSNYDCSNPVYVQRYTSALIANGGGSFGALSVYGPYPMALSSLVSVPVATCDCSSGPCYPTSPGTKTISGIPVVTIPNATGKMAIANIEFITTDGNAKGSGTCMVSIQP